MDRSPDKTLFGYRYYVVLTDKGEELSDVDITSVKLRSYNKVRIQHGDEHLKWDYYKAVSDKLVTVTYQPGDAADPSKDVKIKIHLGAITDTSDLRVPNTITIRVNSNGGNSATGIDVSGNDAGWATGEIKPTAELVAEVDVYNPKFEIKFKKVDAQGNPLGDAVFSLYRCVTTAKTGVDRMDYFPLEGFANQESDETTGIIFDISVDHNNMLRPGKYYQIQRRQ